MKQSVSLVAAALALLTVAVASHGPANSAVAPGADGSAVFASNCVACHGAAGQGVPGAFPPLANNAFVTGDPKAVITSIRRGMSGPIVVNGKPYNGSMPPWKGSLTNEQIAAVITYMRSSWGNKASAVTEKQVSQSKD
jgi:mono/diheme cytochrome c family protein